MNTQTLAARPPTNRSSLRTKIERSIRFGTTSFPNRTRAMFFAFSVLGTIAVCLMIAGAVRSCHILRDEIGMSNVTSSKSSSQCSLSDEECPCNVSSNGTQFPVFCITRLQLHIARILPLASYVLQLFAIRELFTLGVDCNRVLIRVAWVVSSFVLIPIAISMYSNHCYFFPLIVSLFSTSGVVAMLFAHDYVRRKIAEENGRTTEHRILLTSAPPPVEKHAKPWNEIIWSKEDYADSIFWKWHCSLGLIV